MKKYKLTKETKEYLGITLYRIEALRDFGDVKKDELGGWIEKEENLSQNGLCWVYDNARVFDDACVYDNARVYGNACVFGNAYVYDDVHVYDNARVFGSAWVYNNAYIYGDACVYGNAHVFGNAYVYDDACVCDNARVYGNAHVSGDARVYGDAHVFGNLKLKGGYCYRYKLKDTKIEKIDIGNGCELVCENLLLDYEEENDDKFIDIDGVKLSKDTIKEHFKNLFK